MESGSQGAIAVEVRLPCQRNTCTGTLQAISREAISVRLNKESQLPRLAPNMPVELYIQAREAAYRINAAVQERHNDVLIVRLVAPPQVADRRSARRYRVNLPVQITLNNVADGGRYRQQDARAVDISRTGMRLLLHTSVEAGQMLQLEFTLLDVEQPIRATAKVRHVRPHGEGQWMAGVKFTEMARVDAAWLARLFP